MSPAGVCDQLLRVLRVRKRWSRRCCVGKRAAATPSARPMERGCFRLRGHIVVDSARASARPRQRSKNGTTKDRGAPPAALASTMGAPKSGITKDLGMTSAGRARGLTARLAAPRRAQGLTARLTALRRMRRARRTGRARRYRCRAAGSACRSLHACAGKSRVARPLGRWRRSFPRRSRAGGCTPAA